MSMLMEGITLVFTLKTVLLILGGVILGIIFGAIPGLSATMAVALCLPISYTMQPMEGISLLMGLYVGGISGGLISAILLNIPGTPSSIATTFDGAPMARQGRAQEALKKGIFYSFTGTLIGFLALITIAPPLASFALKFGAFEYFSVSLFSLTLISSLVSGSLFKGIASAVFGVVFALVGSAPIDGTSRFTFGMRALNGGISILPLMIGMFAVAEVINMAYEKNDESSLTVIPLDSGTKGLGVTFRELKEQAFNVIRSAAIGIGVGILPGIGGGTSNLLAYIAAKNSSKEPEKFGTGCVDGIIASETSNNAGIGGALIPLLSLGIPGDTTTAMLLGGLILHGLTPGPLMFKKNGDVVYGVFIALLIANIMMLIVENLGLKAFVRVLKVPRYILLPVVMALCIVGAFGNNNRIFDIGCIVFFGVLSYFFMRFSFPLTPMILGFILGGNIELYFRRGLMSSEGDFTPFFTRPISLCFLVIAALTLIFAVIKRVRVKQKT